MLKRQRGEIVQTHEWDGNLSVVTIWKRTLTGDVAVEMRSPEPIDEEVVDAGLRLVRRIAAEIS